MGIDEIKSHIHNVDKRYKCNGEYYKHAVMSGELDVEVK